MANLTTQYTSSNVCSKDYSLICETIHNPDISVNQKSSIIRSLLNDSKDFIDLNIDYAKGNTALHFAILRRLPTAAIELLLQYGANPFQPNSEQATAFEWIFLHSLEKDILKLVKLFHAVNPDATNRLNELAILHQVILQEALPARRKWVILDALLAIGVQPNLPDQDGDYPLHLVITELSPKEIEPILKLFLIKGADLNLSDQAGNVPLHFAILRRLPTAAIELLLQYGANPFQPNSEQATAFEWIFLHSLEKDILKLVKLFHAVNPDATNRLNELAILHQVILQEALPARRKWIILDALLAIGVQPNLPDQDGDYPLHLVLTKLSLQEVESILKLLLSKGADPNRPDQDNHYPLHLAIGQSLPLCSIELLLQYGANANIPDQNGHYPLHLALFAKDPRFATEIGQLLLRHKADIHLPNNKDETPAQWVYEKAHPLLALFREHTKRQWYTAYQQHPGKEILSYIYPSAAIELLGNKNPFFTEIIKLILEQNNVLKYEMIDQLFQRGIDPDIQDKTEKSLLTLLLLSQDYQAIRILFKYHVNLKPTLIALGITQRQYAFCLRFIQESPPHLLTQHLDTIAEIIYHAGVVKDYPFIIDLLSILKTSKKINLNNIRNRQGETILYSACRAMNEELITILLEHDANPKVENHHLQLYDFKNPLEFTKHNHLALLFLDYFDSIDDLPAYNRENLLWRAYADQKYGDLKLLIQKGCNIEDEKDGKTLLQKAFDEHQVDCSRVLLQYHAAIPMTISTAENPIDYIYAIQRYYPQIAALFIKQLDKSKHRYAVSKAFQNKNKALIQTLVQEGIIFDGRDSAGNTALHLTILSSCSKNIIVSLLQQGINLNVQNKNGKTALHLAIQNYRSCETIVLFLDHGADPNILDQAGNTALHLVAICLNRIETNGKIKPEHKALMESQLLKIAKKLILYQANCDTQNNRGNTPSDLHENKVGKIINQFKKLGNDYKLDKGQLVIRLRLIHALSKENALLEGIQKKFHTIREIVKPSLKKPEQIKMACFIDLPPEIRLKILDYLLANYEYPVKVQQLQAISFFSKPKEDTYLENGHSYDLGLGGNL